MTLARLFDICFLNLSPAARTIGFVYGGCATFGKWRTRTRDPQKIQSSCRFVGFTMLGLRAAKEYSRVPGPRIGSTVGPSERGPCLAPMAKTGTNGGPSGRVSHVNWSPEVLHVAVHFPFRSCPLRACVRAGLA